MDGFNAFKRWYCPRTTLIYLQACSRKGVETYKNKAVALKLRMPFIFLKGKR
jgi:hypothetical protein